MEGLPGEAGAAPAERMGKLRTMAIAGMEGAVGGVEVGSVLVFVLPLALVLLLVLELVLVLILVLELPLVLISCFSHPLITNPALHPTTLLTNPAA